MNIQALSEILADYLHHHDKAEFLQDVLAKFPHVFLDNDHITMPQSFDHVERIDTEGVIDVTGEHKYFTKLPISPLSYQREHKTQADFSYLVDERYLVFFISDDSGVRRVLVWTHHGTIPLVLQNFVENINNWKRVLGKWA